MNNLTFGRKLAMGYALMVLITIILSIVAIMALRGAVASKDRVINVNSKVLQEAQILLANGQKASAEQRGFYLTRDEKFLEEIRETRQDFERTLERIRPLVYTEEGKRLVPLIEQAYLNHVKVSDDVIALAKSQARVDVVVKAFDDNATPARVRLDDHINALITHDTRLLEESQIKANQAVDSAVNTLVIFVIIAVILALMIGYYLASTLNRQIGNAVSHVQSSSAELQTASTQTASGARQQASAMNEITTTISELVATSRQIAESAQRVSKIAEQTAAAARHGEGTVGTGQGLTNGTRQQVDQVVTHMLDLGKKSQQIGSVLDIVSELAEQTNILAINATIEASGAGENGRRFGVVADEIRKLADRVATSTKQIRGLIEDVRSAVNTTVMATESMSKTVDSGARQFSEVAVAFKQISALVGTTTDAAREIELSTKQQATAAEQVRTAVSEVAQATQETEISTSQTLQTASQLAGLSRDLMRLIRPDVATA